MLTVADQLPRLGRERANLSFTCNYVVSVRRGFLFLLVLWMGCVILLWHSLTLPYNYLTAEEKTIFSRKLIYFALKHTLCVLSTTQLIFEKSKSKKNIKKNILYYFNSCKIAIHLIDVCSPMNISQCKPTLKYTTVWFPGRLS